MSAQNETLRQLPGIDRLVDLPELAEFSSRISHPVRVQLAKEYVEQLREAALKGGAIGDLSEHVAQLKNRYLQLLGGGIRRVINATGITLHTNLGRAPLGRNLLSNMPKDLAGYCTLEFDIESGLRGSRAAFVERLLRLLCQTEGAVVVNNCAAAVFFVLHTFAQGREVLISRGELVQIGGGFRVPDVLSASGARLVEVGTTNMTAVADYESAITENSAMILKVHQSNFYISGHTEMPSVSSVAGLAAKRKLLSVVDLGSGCLRSRGLDPSDPTVGEVLRSGADLVCFSGDKLLGGPQAGIVIGKKSLIAELKKSPLHRALRLGKTELYLLEKILLNYVGEKTNPTWECLDQSADEVRKNCDDFLAHARLGDLAKIVDGTSGVGGGTLPSVQLPTALIQLAPKNTDVFIKNLRKLDPPLIVRREKDVVYLDFRTIFPDEIAILFRHLKATMDQLNPVS